MEDGIKTYIKGFDDIFDTKTIPKATTVLVYGPMGSGKTTFAFDFVMKGIENGDIGIFVTIDEVSYNLLSDFQRFKCWDINLAFKNKRLFIFDLVYTRTLKPEDRDKYELYRVLEGEATIDILRLFRDKDWLVFGLARPMDLIKLLDRENLIKVLKPYIPNVEEYIKSGKIRFALDSLTSFITAITKEFLIRAKISSLTSFEIEDALRVQMLSLKNRLESNNITSFMTAEALSMDRTRYGIEEFIARGVVYLGQDWVGSRRHRYLVVVKMRGRNHSLGKFGFEISSKHGIIVYGEIP